MTTAAKKPNGRNKLRQVLATAALVCAIAVIPAALAYCVGCLALPSLYALAPGKAATTPLVHPYGDPTAYFATFGALLPGILAGLAYLTRQGPHPPIIDGRAMTAIIVTALAAIAVVIATFYYADQTNQITIRYGTVTGSSSSQT